MFCNVQTIKRKGKQARRTHATFQQNKIDILSILDHKIIHDDSIEYHEK